MTAKQWVNKIIEKEYMENRSKYAKHGILGAANKVESRIDKAIQKTTDSKKKSFLQSAKEEFYGMYD